MFYEAGGPHGLPRDPFKALVAPRPIGWISSMAADGVANLAPFSFFNAISDSPPMVAFSAGPRPTPHRGGVKDSLANVRETGEFVVNLVSYALRDAMNASSQALDPTTDEAAHAGIAMAPCHLVRPQRVADAPAALECRAYDVIPLPEIDEGAGYSLVLGRVIGVHIDDAMLTDGRFDTRRAQLIARMGYRDYAIADTLFTLSRPDEETIGQR